MLDSRHGSTGIEIDKLERISILVLRCVILAVLGAGHATAEAAATA